MAYGQIEQDSNQVYYVVAVLELVAPMRESELKKYFKGAQIFRIYNTRRNAFIRCTDPETRASGPYLLG